MEIIRKAAELLSGCDEITLASVNENGYPRICVLARLKSEDIKKVYVATGMIGTKIKHFKANPKAGVCAWKDGNSVTLIGSVHVTQERAVLEEMWLDWFIEHFPGGVDDPNYCIVEFTAEEATLWIDGEFVTLRGDEL